MFWPFIRSIRACAVASSRKSCAGFVVASILLSDMEENVSPTKVARGLVSCNPRYLVSPVGILKLVEAVCTNIVVYLYGFRVVFRH